jgi:eukaryotic-like serine/threonine-protein kinase
MDSDRWSRLERIFDSVVDLPAGNQEPLLQRECEDDPALLDELRRLLARARSGQESQSNKLFEAIHAVASIPRESDHLPQETSGGPNDPAGGWLGKRLGAYRIVREIGRGGMGVVFEAIREDSEFDKRVALKVAPNAAFSPEFSERFRAERQILARLEHPNIARMLDGGTTAEGVSYFAMEFVDGVPIDEYATSRALTIRQRIGLFLQVCDAVEYAHQNLTVHRDLKPSNILVTKEGSVRLLDFGIAKVLDALDTSKTSTALAPATPGFCSPEQWLGEPITTRTDVYSLGLVLYCLLTGSNPRSSDSKTPAALHREICEEETPLPSVTALAKGDKALARELRSDLDTIVQVATHKQPERRYGSAAALGEDLRRYLDSMPIRARANSTIYQTQRFIRRHWLPVTAGATLLIALIGGIVSTRYQAQRAERRFQQVRKIANRLLVDVQNEIRNLAGSTKAQQIVIQTGVEYLDGLAKEAAGDPALQVELANGYLEVAQMSYAYGQLSNANPELAKTYYQKAKTIVDGLDPTTRSGLAGSMITSRVYQSLGGFLCETGRQGEALPLLRYAIEVTEAAYKRFPEAIDLLEVMSGAYSVLVVNFEGKPASLQALPRYLEISELRVARTPQSAMAKSDLGVAYSQAGKSALEDEGDRVSARMYFRKYIDLLRQSLAAEPDNTSMHRNLMLAWANLGDTALGTLNSNSHTGPYSRRVEIPEKDRREALQAYREALEQAKWRLGRDPGVAAVQMDLAIVQGRGTSGLSAQPADARLAIRTLEGSIDLLKKVEKEHPDAAVRFRLEFEGAMAVRWGQVGDTARAEAQWQEAESFYRNQVARSPENYSLSSLMLRIYRGWFEEKLAQGAVPQAIAIAQRALKEADEMPSRYGSTVPRAASWPPRVRDWFAPLLSDKSSADQMKRESRQMWREFAKRTDLPRDLTKEAEAALAAH